MSLMKFLSELWCVLCGMYAMGIIWFFHDNGKNSPYLRGFEDGYHVGVEDALRVAKMVTEERTDEQT